jgi:hypothetical protein
LELSIDEGSFIKQKDEKKLIDKEGLSFINFERIKRLVENFGT